MRQGAEYMETVKLPHYSMGEGVLRKIGNVAEKYGKKALVVGGKKALAVSQDSIVTSLKEKGISIIDCLWYGGECTYKNIDTLKTKVEAEGVEVIIGVGGGKALDTAKAAGAKTNVPVITVPTIASTCAAVTCLSVVYTEKGDYEGIIFYDDAPPVYTFISVDIIAKAPTKYLWAGIGDTLSKYYEVDITSRGVRLPHEGAMGKSISKLCVEPLIQYGGKALEDNKKGVSSFELQEVVLNIIITTGIVSLLVGEEYLSASAHGIFYGLTILEEIEKHHLHGEVVAYGVLVLLMLDGQKEEVERLISFYKEISLPTSLKDLNVANDEKILDAVLDKTIMTEDHQKMPYPVTKEMYYEAIQKLEMFHQ